MLKNVQFGREIFTLSPVAHTTRVLSTGEGAGGKLPPQKKRFTEKKITAISNKDLF